MDTVSSAVDSLKTTTDSMRVDLLTMDGGLEAQEKSIAELHNKYSQLKAAEDTMSGLR